VAETVAFPCEELTLEGRFHSGSTEVGVVVCHPLPLYGGDMTNPVVTALAHTYQDRDCSWLTFNFRGVGNSGGVYDNGVGEQRDVVAAVAFLRRQGVSVVHLAGYSFGTWVNAQAGEQLADIDVQIMVSPPVAMFDFSRIGAVPGLQLVITGGRDGYAPPQLLEELIPQWAPEAVMKVLAHADHFYSGQIGRLQQIIDEHLAAEFDAAGGDPSAGGAAENQK
jgi:alpha/beta superfamily hydrolase